MIRVGPAAAVHEEAAEPSGHRGAGQGPDQGGRGRARRDRGDAAREHVRERCGQSPRRGPEEAPPPGAARPVVRADRCEEGCEEGGGDRGGWTPPRRRLNPMRCVNSC